MSIPRALVPSGTGLLYLNIIKGTSSDTITYSLFFFSAFDELPDPYALLTFEDALKEEKDVPPPPGAGGDKKAKRKKRKPKIPQQPPPNNNGLTPSANKEER
ncbi:Hypothetical protein FKW44_022507, partial [Caligus rogercresseyi]